VPNLTLVPHAGTASGRALAHDSLPLKGHHWLITGIKRLGGHASHIRAESIVLSHWISETGWVLGYGMFYGTKSPFCKTVHELLSVEFEALWKNLRVCNIM
jgi:hypothetical protein